jgi:c-di-GMP phosphodiesterase
MDRVLMSRQPICRADMSTLGYELLFRDSESNQASYRDEDEATAQVIVNTFMEVGLEEMIGPHQAFINVSRKFLMSDFCEALPADRVVLELMDPIELDPTFMKRLDTLVSLGYKLAVSDFVFEKRFLRLLDLASVVKFDLLANPWHRIEQNISALDGFNVKTVAERVETADQFECSKSIGMDYFQGYFFCRPEFVRSPRLPLSRLITLRLIGKLNDPNLSIDQLEEAIRQDLSLSYKLLRYVGSVGCGVRGKINSIRHAAVLTGIERLRIWAALILFSGIEEGMRELTVTAIVRARMAEKLAESMQCPHPDQFFLVGLLSVLDAMLARPLPEVLETLELAPEINGALLHREGDLGAVLECVLAYERRDWGNVRCGNLDYDTIRGAYVKAMAWSIRTLNGFSDAVAPEIVNKENSKHLRR